MPKCESSVGTKVEGKREWIEEPSSPQQALLGCASFTEGVNQAGGPAGCGGPRGTRAGPAPLQVLPGPGRRARRSLPARRGSGCAHLPTQWLRGARPEGARGGRGVSGLPGGDSGALGARRSAQGRSLGSVQGRARKPSLWVGRLSTREMER